MSSEQIYAFLSMLGATATGSALLGLWIAGKFRAVETLINDNRAIAQEKFEAVNVRLTRLETLIIRNGSHDGRYEPQKEPTP